MKKVSIIHRDAINEKGKLSSRRDHLAVIHDDKPKRPRCRTKDKVIIQVITKERMNQNAGYQRAQAIFFVPESSKIVLTFSPPSTQNDRPGKYNKNSF